MFIGGVDVSLNTWANADPHWCLHIYGFVVLPAGWGVANKRRRLALRAAIAKHCPLAEPVAGRPNERPLLVSTRTRFEFERKVLYGHKGGVLPAVTLCLPEAKRDGPFFECHPARGPDHGLHHSSP